MTKQKTGKSRHQSALLEWQFGDVAATERLVDRAAHGILLYAKEALSDDPYLRQAGLKNIRKIAEFAVAGEFALRDQASKAKKKRGTIEDGNGERFSMVAVVRDLVRKNPDSKPAELWPHFLSVLESRGLNPTETAAVNLRQDSIPSVDFDVAVSDRYPGGRRSVTLRSFGSTISQVKKKS